MKEVIFLRDEKYAFDGIRVKEMKKGDKRLVSDSDAEYLFSNQIAKAAGKDAQDRETKADDDTKVAGKAKGGK